MRVYFGEEILIKSKNMFVNRNLDPKHIRFYVGYTGWEAGQLEEEIEQDFWIKTTGANEAIFYTPSLDVWSKTLQKDGRYLQINAQLSRKPFFKLSFTT
jgi:putative transcriptional regulator